MNLEQAFTQHYANCTEDMSALPTRQLNGRAVRFHSFTALIERNGQSVSTECNHVQKQVDGQWVDVPIRVVNDRIFPDLA